MTLRSLVLLVRNKVYINLILSSYVLSQDTELVSPSEEKLELIQLVGNTPKLYPPLPSNHPLERPRYQTSHQILYTPAIDPTKHRHFGGHLPEFKAENHDIQTSVVSDDEHIFHKPDHKVSITHDDNDSDLEMVETGEESLINADNQGIEYDMSHEYSPFLHHDEPSDEDVMNSRDHDKQTKEGVMNSLSRNRGGDIEENHRHISHSLETVEELEAEQRVLDRKGGDRVVVEGKSDVITNDDITVFAEEVDYTDTTITLQFPASTEAEEDALALYVVVTLLTS